MKTKNNKTAKTSTKATKTTKKAPKAASRVAAAPKLFEGTVTATRVLNRPMKEFKFPATCWLLISEQEGVYIFANSYHGDTPKHSYDPANYRYPLTDKTRKALEKKIETDGYREIDVDLYPAWITTAKRKTKAK